MRQFIGLRLNQRSKIYDIEAMFLSVNAKKIIDIVLKSLRNDYAIFSGDRKHSIKLRFAIDLLHRHL